ncbi:hypothetical protein NDU88_007935 [Pleurodeles waltl]|uniref:Uncharacterized protein n=1 Tax=Pleurodeles waltl TaxID=8319 RepID=A0AAV7VR45_PLEWA|nr:hypothetical protein NDU88_007935 [Pleurodeles waltl]
MKRPTWAPWSRTRSPASCLTRSQRRSVGPKTGAEDRRSGSGGLQASPPQDHLAWGSGDRGHYRARSHERAAKTSQIKCCVKCTCRPRRHWPARCEPTVPVDLCPFALRAWML